MRLLYAGAFAATLWVLPAVAATTAMDAAAVCKNHSKGYEAIAQYRASGNSLEMALSTVVRDVESGKAHAQYSYAVLYAVWFVYVLSPDKTPEQIRQYALDECKKVFGIQDA